MPQTQLIGIDILSNFYNQDAIFITFIVDVVVPDDVLVLVVVVDVINVVLGDVIGVVLSVQSLFPLFTEQTQHKMVLHHYHHQPLPHRSLLASLLAKCFHNEAQEQYTIDFISVVLWVASAFKNHGRRRRR